MITLTLYTTSNCPLCDSLKADLLAIQPEIGFVLLEHDINSLPASHISISASENETKLDQYKNLIPILDIEDGAILYSPIGYDELFDAIDAAVSSHKGKGAGTANLK